MISFFSSLGYPPDRLLLLRRRLPRELGPDALGEAAEPPGIVLVQHANSHTWKKRWPN